MTRPVTTDDGLRDYIRQPVFVDRRRGWLDWLLDAWHRVMG